MSFWIEIRCEEQTACEYASERCLSYDGRAPMGFASGISLSAVTQKARKLSTKATNSGWVKTRGGWVCPHCNKRRENAVSGGHDD